MKAEDDSSSSLLMMITARWLKFSNTSGVMHLAELRNFAIEFDSESASLRVSPCAVTGEKYKKPAISAATKPAARQREIRNMTSPTRRYSAKARCRDFP